MVPVVLLGPPVGADLVTPGACEHCSCDDLDDDVCVCCHSYPCQLSPVADPPDGQGGHPLYGHNTKWLPDDSVWCDDCNGVVAVADG